MNFHWVYIYNNFWIMWIFEYFIDSKTLVYWVLIYDGWVSICVDWVCPFVMTGCQFVTFWCQFVTIGCQFVTTGCLFVTTGCLISIICDNWVSDVYYLWQLGVWYLLFVTTGCLMSIICDNWVSDVYYLWRQQECSFVTTGYPLGHKTAR